MENKNQNKSELEKILDTLKETNADIGTEELGALLALPDEDFNLISEPILLELEKSLNNTNDKIVLEKMLRESSTTGREVAAAYQEVINEIDNALPSFSQVKRDFLKRTIAILANLFLEVDGQSKDIVKIPIELCNSDAKIPTYANIGDSGMDIFALEDITINPGETKLIKTGLKVAIPIGYELQVRPKSGRSLKTKLRVANTPGTIDSGYRDEIGIIIENVNSPIKDIEYHFEDGKVVIDSILHGESYIIEKGDKFAQLVLTKISTCDFYQIENIGEIEGDRGGGFGSTGVK